MAFSDDDDKVVWKDWAEAEIEKRDKWLRDACRLLRIVGHALTEAEIESGRKLGPIGLLPDIGAFLHEQSRRPK